VTILDLKLETVEWTPAPAPQFHIDCKTVIRTHTIYGGHYDRMMAVVDAAKSGNRILIKFALENYDAGGCEP
jgi:hypothetical protein